MTDQSTIDEFVGVAHGDFSRLKELLAQDPDFLNAISGWGETAIQAAAQTGQVEIARYLLDRGAPLDLYTAAMLGMGEDVDRFLQADPSLAHSKGIHGLPALWFPALHGHLAIAQKLHALGAEVNAGAGGNTPLHGAVFGGQVEMAKWLLEQGADPNALDFQNRTPLALASAANHTRLVDLLLANGAKEQ